MNSFKIMGKSLSFNCRMYYYLIIIISFPLPIKKKNKTFYISGFPGGSDSKKSACNAGDPTLIPGSGRSPGERNGYPCSILAWRIPWTEEPSWLVHGVRKSWT